MTRSLLVALHNQWRSTQVLQCKWVRPESSFLALDLVDKALGLGLRLEPSGLGLALAIRNYNTTLYITTEW